MLNIVFFYQAHGATVALEILIQAVLGSNLGQGFEYIYYLRIFVVSRITFRRIPGSTSIKPRSPCAMFFQIVESFRSKTPKFWKHRS
jgi:hypothetical protein